MPKFILISFILFSCSGAGPFVAYDTGAKYCGEACDNLFKLSCDGWKGSPGIDEKFGTEDDISCIEVCKTISSSMVFTLHAECISKANTCLEVDACMEH